MTVDGSTLPSAGVYRYRGMAPCDRPVGDYTPRVIPFHPEALIPLELPLILWQK